MKTEPNSEHAVAHRKRLLQELKNHQERVERARQDLQIDSDPDDDAGIASRNTYREATMGKLERDLQTIIEIERAVRRLDEGVYATCVACESRIPEARLKAIPWTRTCIECAGRRGTLANGLFRLNPNLAH
jgi:RNA polymerase-binding transcription factor DksA